MTTKRKARPRDQASNPAMSNGNGKTVGGTTLFVYAVTLVLRRRRWERALQMSEPAADPESTPAGSDQP